MEAQIDCATEKPTICVCFFAVVMMWLAMSRLNLIFYAVTLGSAAGVVNCFSARMGDRGGYGMGMGFCAAAVCCCCRCHCREGC